MMIAHAGYFETEVQTWWLVSVGHQCLQIPGQTAGPAFKMNKYGCRDRGPAPAAPL